MNELEKKYGLIEQSSEERLYNEPTAFNLREIPKVKQTYEMLMKVCSCDGLALRYASKRLISFELCEIAVKQNGCALEYVPEKIFENVGEEYRKELYNAAVVSNGLALQYIPKKYITVEMVEQAVQYYIDGYKFTPEKVEKAKKQGSELSEWRKYPIALVPKDFLSDELIKKAVSYSPFCFRDIDGRKITKELAFLAVKTNGLSLKYLPDRYLTGEFASLAIESEPMSIQYIPKSFITQELCDKCLKKNYMSFAYIPEEFITESMCLKAAGSRVFSIFKLSSATKEKVYGKADIELILFSDFPEEMRNNHLILDCIISRYKNGALPLISWNDEVKKYIEKNGLLRADKDKRGNPIIPLKEETIEYLLPKVIEIRSRNAIGNGSVFVPSVNLREVKRQTESITLPIPKETSDITALVKQKESTVITHELTEEQSYQKIYYVTDIHMEHHMLYDEKLRKRLQKAKTKFDKKTIIKDWIEHKVSELIANVDIGNMLLIGGDVADSIDLSDMFYECLDDHWSGKIISVLGNHELWDGTKPENWNDPSYKSRSVEEIVDDYKKCHDNDNYKDFWSSKDFLLENELYVLYQNQKQCIVKESDIINSSEAVLTEFLSKCSTIILGGIGYSGLNHEFNAECLEGHQISEGMGLYRKAITSLEEDRYRSERFRCIYEKVLRCSSGKKIIVLTHTQIENWTPDAPLHNCIYINGHTHQNTFKKTEDGIVVLADNQIGYGLTKEKKSNQTRFQLVYNNPKWKLNSFIVNKIWYDPFENYHDGIYTISSDQYRDFCIGRGMNGTNYSGIIHMLKKGEYYSFILENLKGKLLILNGGAIKRLKYDDLEYYYNNLENEIRILKTPLDKFYDFEKAVANEVRRLGGFGDIHGCIIDIDFYNHVYINPVDGSITGYWASDMINKKVYASVPLLLKDECPRLYRKFMMLTQNNDNGLPLLSKGVGTEIAVLPRSYYDTDIYKASRVIKIMQKLYLKVLAIWNDLTDGDKDVVPYKRKQNLKTEKIEKKRSLDSVKQFAVLKEAAERYGVDEKLLFEIANSNPTKADINNEMRLTKLISTCDVDKIKKYYDTTEFKAKLLMSSDLTKLLTSYIYSVK